MSFHISVHIRKTFNRAAILTVNYALDNHDLTMHMYTLVTSVGYLKHAAHRSMCNTFLLAQGTKLSPALPTSLYCTVRI